MPGRAPAAPPPHYCRTCAVRVFKKPRVGEKAYACWECRAVLCGGHTFYYFDGCNIAITRNARPYCAGCYSDRYKYKEATK